MSIAREPEGLLPEVFFEQVRSTIAPRRRNFDGKLAKSRPEFSGPGRIVGMKGADRTLLRKVLGGGADGSKVKDEYLHPAQDAPDRFVIVRDAHVAQVRSERPPKSSHVVTCGTRTVDTFHECSRIAQLSRPSQNVLIRSVNFV